MQHTHSDVRVCFGAAGPFPFYGGPGNRQKQAKRRKVIKILLVNQMCQPSNHVKPLIIISWVETIANENMTPNFFSKYANMVHKSCHAHCGLKRANVRTGAVVRELYLSISTGSRTLEAPRGNRYAPARGMRLMMISTAFGTEAGYAEDKY